MKHKLLTLFLVLAASIGITNAAIVNGTCGDNLTWTLNTKDSTLVIEGSGEMTEAPWKSYSSYIAYVSFPEGLTNIVDEAFSSSKFTSITIPNSVTSIGERAFYFCERLTSVTIPNNVTYIGQSAFASCYSMTSVTIGNSVEGILEYTFAECSSLSSVIIGNSIEYIDGVAFFNCIIDEIHFVGTIDEWVNKKWNPTLLLSREDSEYVYYTLFIDDSLIDDIEIPYGVTNIGSNAFARCGSLHSVTIPNSVISIGNSAFSECRNLISVTIGNGVTSIGNWAFGRCGNLAQITCEAVEPPLIAAANTFTSVNKTIPLFVLEESIEAYSNAIIWEDFTNILAIGTIIDDPTSAPAEVVNPTNKAQKLIREGNVYILRDNGTYSATGLKVE